MCHFLSAGNAGAWDGATVNGAWKPVASSQGFAMSQKMQVYIHLEGYQGEAAMPRDTERSPKEMWRPVRPLRQRCPEGRERSRIGQMGTLQF